jgi:hypothetical protein
VAVAAAVAVAMARAANNQQRSVNVGGGGGGGGDGGGGGGGSDGGGLRTEVRVEIGVTHMKERVPHKEIGDYLPQSRAMRLANVQTFGSQCLASKQTSICATDLFVCTDRKMVNLYKKSRFYIADT